MGHRRPSILLRGASTAFIGVGVQGVDGNVHASRRLSSTVETELERRAMSRLPISPASPLAILFNGNEHVDKSYPHHG
jgi:hypothetical protein